MTARLLVVGLAGALLGALVAMWWPYGDRGVIAHGMSENPCNAERLPVSGMPEDDWGQLCVFRAENRQLLEKRSFPEVVMIGDSITARWPTAGRDVANRGIGGQVSAQVLLRFRQDAIGLRPSVIHILVGINDISGLRGPQSPDMVRNDIAAMVELARANAIPVVIGTIGPARDVASRPQVDRRKWVPAINGWLRRFAQSEGVIIADYHAVLSRKDGSMRSELFADTVHPNEKGYAAMAPVLRAAIEQAGRQGKDPD